MVRVKDLEKSIAFYNLLGLKEIKRNESEMGRFTLVFLAPDGQHECPLELTFNWDPEEYSGGRNFGHLAYQVDNIYELCQSLQESGVVINRPPKEGRMAFIRSPDGVSIELLQKGEALEIKEPWASMGNTGVW